MIPVTFVKHFHKSDRDHETVGSADWAGRGNAVIDSVI
jgi:hypothetical protein